VSQSFSVVLLQVVGFIKPAGLVTAVGACRGGHFLLQLCFGEEGSFEARAMFVLCGFVFGSFVRRSVGFRSARCGSGVGFDFSCLVGSPLRLRSSFWFVVASNCSQWLLGCTALIYDSSRFVEICSFLVVGARFSVVVFS
jgi:hypothetical protein